MKIQNYDMSSEYNHASYQSARQLFTMFARQRCYNRTKTFPWQIAKRLDRNTANALVSQVFCHPQTQSVSIAATLAVKNIYGFGRKSSISRVPAEDMQHMLTSTIINDASSAFSCYRQKVSQTQEGRQLSKLCTSTAVTGFLVGSDEADSEYRTLMQSAQNRNTPSPSCIESKDRSR
jgi:hypothetical protein